MHHPSCQAYDDRYDCQCHYLHSGDCCVCSVMLESQTVYRLFDSGCLFRKQCFATLPPFCRCLGGSNGFGRGGCGRGCCAASSLSCSMLLVLSSSLSLLLPPLPGRLFVMSWSSILKGAQISFCFLTLAPSRVGDERCLRFGLEYQALHLEAAIGPQPQSL